MYTEEHTLSLLIPAAEGEGWCCFAGEECTAAAQVPFQLGPSPNSEPIKSLKSYSICIDLYKLHH